MARIFISFNHHDSAWERWMNARLRALGHVPLAHVDAPGGINIQRWMDSNLKASERFLPVLSPNYLSAAGCQMEYDGALGMMMRGDRDSNSYLLQIRVQPCSLPIMAPQRYLLLDELWVQDARAAFDAFVGAEPPGSALPPWNAEPAFPGWSRAISNIPVRVPSELPGRDMLADIGEALNKYVGRIAAIALVGMPGSGKSIAAAAYAEQRSDRYKATWWIRASDPGSMEADLAELGVRLRWAAPDENEKEGVDYRAILRRLEREGDHILLIYDNALSAEHLKGHLPNAGAAHVLITSTALGSWSDLAAKIQIRLWPKDLGAEFLLRRAGSAPQRADAEALWEAFEGLPLALALIGAYCENTGMSLAQFRRRHAMGRLSVPDPVGRTIGFVMDEAQKLQPAAECLLRYAALLEAEPIPLCLFEEGADCFAEDAAHFRGGKLDEAIAALRRYGLVERIEIQDERSPDAPTDCIRLHRVVRELAAKRWSDEQDQAKQSQAALGQVQANPPQQAQAQQVPIQPSSNQPDQANRGRTRRDRAKVSLIAAMAKVYPPDGYDVITLWPLARRLDPHALALVVEFPAEAGVPAAELMDKLACYRVASESSYERSRALFERALSLRQQALDPFDPRVAQSLSNLALLSWAQKDWPTARALITRALEIRERAHGTQHPQFALGLINSARILRDCGEGALADSYLDRALAILEAAPESHDPDIAFCLSAKVRLCLAQGRVQEAQPLSARALEIYSRTLGLQHPATAAAMTNEATVLEALNRPNEAMQLLERALAVRESALGPEHSTVAHSMLSVADLADKAGQSAKARSLRERALAILEKKASDRYAGQVADLRARLGTSSPPEIRHINT